MKKPAEVIIIQWKMKDGKSVRFQQESPSAFNCGGASAFPKNACPFCSGIGVRFQQESVSVFNRNECPFCARICNFKEVLKMGGAQVH